MKAIYFLAITSLLTIRCNGQNDSLHSKQLPDSNGVYTFAEHMPEFPGGDAELMRFFQKNFHASELQKEDEICGKISMRWRVEIDGSVKDPIMLRHCGEQIDYELLRLASSLPKFKPASQDGKTVKAYFYLSIYDFFGR